jgi:hypothetical protein
MGAIRMPLPPYMLKTGHIALSAQARFLPGASFTQVEGDKIRSEQVYLDRLLVLEQLGLKPK